MEERTSHGREVQEPHPQDGGYVPMIQYPSIKGETDGTGT